MYGRCSITKKLLAFDMDHTLSLPNEPITDEVACLLMRAMQKFDVCVVSGQSFDQFLVRVIERLPVLNVELFRHLHCLPAQGTQYYCFSQEYGWEWSQVYAYYLKPEQMVKITSVIEQAAKELGYWHIDKLEEGDKLIKNNLSQMTFAALGMKADIEEKRLWDPDCKKRTRIAMRCKELAPEFEYKIGGTTSIDVTVTGLDKGFGMRCLMEKLDLKREDILYFGDMTQPGGNDYPVVEMGIDTITVHEYYGTVYALEGILGVVN